jgi:hypothetical protein
MENASSGTGKIWHAIELSDAVKELGGSVEHGLQGPKYHGAWKIRQKYLTPKKETGR